MYVAVREAKIKPGKMQEIVGILNQEYVPTIKQVPGFVAFYASQTAEDQITTITIFENEEGAQESTRQAHAIVAGSLAPLMTSTIDADHGEVFIAETRSSQGS